MNINDTPVLIIFFNRPKVLKDLFEWVRQVKPKQLFLVQDGAREGNATDEKNILECRKIVENVDWECDVKKNYSSVNLTCDQREYSGIDWGFQYTDRLIILEDDCLPSVSFYRFCAEMLEKFKEDNRIHVISGFNRCNRYEESPYDYVFSKTGAGIGWATWKRVWDNVRDIKEMPLLENENEFNYYNDRVSENAISGGENRLVALKKAKEFDDREGKVHSWELLVGGTSALFSTLGITPTRNLIKYNGITEGATHSFANESFLPRKIRAVLTQCSYELEFPLKHPPYVVRDKEFEKLDRCAVKQTSKVISKFEVLFNVLRAGRFDIVMEKVKKRIAKNK